jgi:hypothetical protein
MWAIRMKEYQPPEAEISPITSSPKVPVSAYIMAVISGVFVTFGVMFLAAFSHLFVGDMLSTAPKPVLMAIPYIAIGLGILTVWQTIRQAKRKALQEPKGKKA